MSKKTEDIMAIITSLNQEERKELFAVIFSSYTSVAIKIMQEHLKPKPADSKKIS